MSAQDIIKIRNILENIENRPQSIDNSVLVQYINVLNQELKKFQKEIPTLFGNNNNNQNLSNLNEASLKQKLGSLALAGGLALGALGGAKNADAQQYKQQSRATATQQNFAAEKTALIKRLGMCQASFLVGAMIAQRNQDQDNLQSITSHMKAVDTLMQLAFTSEEDKKIYQLSAQQMKNTLLERFKQGHNIQREVEAMIHTCIELNNRLASTLSKNTSQSTKTKQDNTKNSEVKPVELDVGTYTGQLKDGQPHGKGVMKFNNSRRYFGNSVYDGEWQNGKPHGQGVMKYDEDGLLRGSVYTGEWHSGDKHGKGRYTFGSTGDVYVGDFASDNIHGKGTMYNRDGSVYVGDFWKNAENGQGTLTKRNGEKLSGTFQNGKFIGNGSKEDEMLKDMMRLRQ